MLGTYGLQGCPTGHTPQLVVPVSSEAAVPPDALFALLAQQPDGAARPSLAIVDSCLATVVYIGIDDALPAPPV